MSKVALIPTSPQSVLDDYSKLMDLLNYQDLINKEFNTVIKINLSWSLFYPACSTPPWQLEGVLRKMITDGFQPSNILPVENQTVVTHPWKGAYLNKWLPILKKYETDYLPLTNEEWISYDPKGDVPAMRELFKDKIIIPKIYKGANVVHLPTIKPHGHTVMTGTMKNAFGGLIPKYRHHSHKMIHEILVDLLTIQKEIHPGLLAVMDGSVAGDGAGPRIMTPVLTNLLLASEDQVAIDAVSAKLMGYDPMQIDFIKMAHDQGLGMGDVDQLDIVGMDSEEFSDTNFNFKTKKSIVVKWDQRLRKTTYRYRPLKPLHYFLFYTPFFQLFIMASGVYHDWLWYPLIGKRRIKKFKADTEWGKLFDSYDFGPKLKKYPEIKNWDRY